MQDTIRQIKKRLDTPIVLVGMMGCGKSYIGSLLAKELGVDFIDSDQKVEEAAGYDTARIFELDGEEKFRKLEARVVAELCDRPSCVIATGGGAVISEDTRAVIKNKTLSIWLNDDIDVLVERVGKSDKRPLLTCGNAKETLENLLRERSPYYKEADIIIKGDDHGVRKKVKDLLNALDEFLYR